MTKYFIHELIFFYIHCLFFCCWIKIITFKFSRQNYHNKDDYCKLMESVVKSFISTIQRMNLLCEIMGTLENNENDKRIIKIKTRISNLYFKLYKKWYWNLFNFLYGYITIWKIVYLYISFVVSLRNFVWHTDDLILREKI